MTCQGDESPIVRNSRHHNRQIDAFGMRFPVTAIMPFALRHEGANNEGQSIRQKDLQQMQNHQA